MSFLRGDWPSFLWGAAVGGIGACLITFFRKDCEAAADYLKGKLTKTPSDHGKALLVEFQRDVAADLTLLLFKVPDFDRSFRRSELRPLNNFVETWTSVEQEFSDSRLEAEEKKRRTSAEKLASEIAGLTSPVGDGTLSSVYSDSVRSGFGVDERPDCVKEQAKTLNAFAAPFAVEHEAFVRLCRERLKV
jgi:hypothetical protein